MEKENISAGLDMGGGKVTCIISSVEGKGEPLKILAGATVPCKGLKGGIVVDIKEAMQSAATAVEEAEKIAAKEVTGVFLGIRGAHIQSISSHGAYNISRTDREITAEDVTFAIENAKAVPLSTNMEVLDVIPQMFSIDRQRGIPNPEGMEGSLLEVDAHIVSAATSHLSNLTKAVNKAGFYIDEPLYGLVCLGETVLTPEEKELGAVLIDLGAESISVGVYADGCLKYSKEIPFGCDLITRDIAYGLHTSNKTAKEIKEKYGYACASTLIEEEEVPVLTLDGASKNNIKSGFIVEIIQPRVEEIFEKIRAEVEASGFLGIAALGVLTGGGSLLKGMTHFCAQSLGLKEVRLGTVIRDYADGEEKYFDPVYTTALSLAIYPLASKRRNFSARDKQSTWSKIKDLFSSMDIFSKP